MSKLKWRIAYLVDRLSNQCWADLVEWALASRRDRRNTQQSALPWRPISATSCQADAKRTGACYCGKVRATGDRS